MIIDYIWLVWWWWGRRGGGYKFILVVYRQLGGNLVLRYCDNIYTASSLCMPGIYSIYLNLFDNCLSLPIIHDNLVE